MQDHKHSQAGAGRPAAADSLAQARAQVSVPVAIPEGRRVLAEEYDVALLDLDGVVYSGSSAVAGAVPALAAARRAGLRLAFVTNNASRPPSAIAAQLAGLGVPARPQDVITSAQAAASLLADRLPPGAPVLVAGGIGLRLALHDKGLRPVSTAAERPVAVVQGFAPDISYGLLAEAALAIRAGALFVAANTDPTLPTPRGPQPGNGSLVQVIVVATGTLPIVAGKPEPPLHAEAIARTGARHPLVVGDRLDTDIEGAVRAGADSLLVLTGVSGPVDLLLAPARQRPTYLAAALGGLLERQPVIGPVRARGDGQDGGDGGAGGDGRAAAAAFRCGGWTASRGPGGEPLELSGSGEPIDGLRALCAAAWSADPAAEITAGMVQPALSALGYGGADRPAPAAV